MRPHDQLNPAAMQIARLPGRLHHRVFRGAIELGGGDHNKVNVTVGFVVTPGLRPEENDPFYRPLRTDRRDGSGNRCPIEVGKRKLGQMNQASSPLWKSGAEIRDGRGLQRAGLLRGIICVLKPTPHQAGRTQLAPTICPLDNSMYMRTLLGVAFVPFSGGRKMLSWQRSILHFQLRLPRPKSFSLRAILAAASWWRGGL